MIVTVSTIPKAIRQFPVALPPRHSCATARDRNANSRPGPSTASSNATPSLKYVPTQALKRRSCMSPARGVARSSNEPHAAPEAYKDSCTDEEQSLMEQTISNTDRNMSADVDGADGSKCPRLQLLALPPTQTWCALLAEKQRCGNPQMHADDSDTMLTPMLSATPFQLTGPPLVFRRRRFA